MPWRETDVRNERILFVVAALQGEESTSAVCRRFGISRKTGYKWLARYKSVESLSELCEQSRRPLQSPQRSPEATEQRVLTLRERYGWGSRKLQHLLAGEKVKLSRSTIDRILDRHGVARTSPHARSAPKRFERSQPNELVQMDFKGQYRLASQGWCYPLSLIDDHSRFALALEGLGSLQGNGVEATLRATFEREGVPEAMLMDHGAPWWSPANGHGLTEVSVFLIRQGVDLVHSGIAHPQTQGKVERFHRTLEAWLLHHGVPRSLADFQSAFRDFRLEYNTVRPHEALDLQTPARRYRPSLKPYRPEPPEWEYPLGAEVAGIDRHGSLHLDGGRRFVCEALRGQRVRLERFGDRVLVSYRHMLIRELDLTTGSSRTVLKPRAELQR